MLWGWCERELEGLKGDNTAVLTLLDMNYLVVVQVRLIYLGWQLLE